MRKFVFCFCLSICICLCVCLSSIVNMCQFFIKVHEKKCCTYSKQGARPPNISQSISEDTMGGLPPRPPRPFTQTNTNAKRNANTNANTNTNGKINAYTYQFNDKYQFKEKYEYKC